MCQGLFIREKAETVLLAVKKLVRIALPSQVALEIFLKEFDITASWKKLAITTYDTCMHCIFFKT